MKELACLIPCYNESKNLLTLCEEIELTKNKNIDWYLINNGSLDLDKDEFENIIKRKVTSSNVKIFNIEKNNGYGNGIKTCLLNIIDNYEAFCWTHADGQTPLDDVVTSYHIFSKKKQNIDLIKGVRVSRKDGLIATTFTMFFNFIIFFLLNYKSRSPNSQPTLLTSKMAKQIIKHCQNDANFDVSVLLYAKKLNFKIVRFPVIFRSRRLGMGTNETFNQKLKYSWITLQFLLKNMIKR